MSDPRRILAFSGTRAEFWDYLLFTLPAEVALRNTDADETYEWELTASIARHPAGKGLVAGDDR